MPWKFTLNLFIREKSHSNVTFASTAVLKRVPWRDMLNQFMREKSHSNVTCEYRCSLKGRMNQHVASVHKGKKSFKCNICDATFSDNSYMKTHVSKIHEGKKLWTMPTKDTLLFWINIIVVGNQIFVYIIYWFIFFQIIRIVLLQMTQLILRQSSKN